MEWLRRVSEEKGRSFDGQTNVAHWIAEEIHCSFTIEVTGLKRARSLRYFLGGNGEGDRSDEEDRDHNRQGGGD